MEVHHHPHVEKKSFKEYLLEGLMIFIAVSMGFIAEGIRENITKHEKEHHLMEILFQDLKEDSARLGNALSLSVEKYVGLDSLTSLCFQATEKVLTDSQYRRMYYYLRKYAYTGVGVFVPTTRAAVLLDKSDAFSLIRRQNISDSILEYEDNIKRMDNQFTTYIAKRDETQIIAQKLFDYKLIQEIVNRTDADAILHNPRHYVLLSNDKALLQAYGSGSWLSKALLLNYIKMLRAHQQLLNHLLTDLTKEYQLGKE